MFEILILENVLTMLLLQLFFFLLLKTSLASQASVVNFFNFHSEKVVISWQDPNDKDRVVEVGSLTPYTSVTLSSSVGHQFMYTLNGNSETVTVTEEKMIFNLGPRKLLVQCSTSEGVINANIVPEHSPHGAARFLDLVDTGYYDGCALNRVVPNFLTQFGIGANYEARTELRMKHIPDDEPKNHKFEPGYMAFAGSGKDSRTTEVFIVMPGTPQRQLDYFGINSWETPFGWVEMEDVNEVVSKWYPYGDLPPHGDGPDPQLIYKENGYEYLKKNFPNMSYIATCQIVHSSSEYRGEDGEEL